MKSEKKYPDMHIVRLNILIVFLCLQFSALFSQEVSVTAKLDTNAMLIGDHVGLTLKFSGPSAVKVLWPFIPDTILGNISVIGRGKIDTTFSEDRKSVTFSQEFNITCYDSGFYTIPQIPFQYRLTPDTTRLSGTSGLLLLAVHTVKVDTTQAIKPIIGPLKVPITFREMLPWLLAGLAVILIVIFIIWYISKRKKKQPVLQFKAKVVLLPHETALQELEKLRTKKLWQSGKIKAYHSELTEILRKYIEDRFQIQALEQTSSEIIQNLQNNPVCPHTTLDRLNDLLVHADMVKFAKAQPVASENERSLTEAITFINETTGISNHA
ncbi:MAG: BatA domain-containing protein [Bacteroidota bacterium]